ARDRQTLTNTSYPDDESPAVATAGLFFCPPLSTVSAGSYKRMRGTAVSASCNRCYITLTGPSYIKVNLRESRGCGAPCLHVWFWAGSRRSKKDIPSKT